ncbi:hypothetical protein U1Q18_001344 [Sarracenia purpurea var. burkii]
MRRGRGTGATKRGVPRDAAACPIGNPSVGKKTPQNMFGGEDDGAGGVGYMERGLTIFDHNYLSELSAPEIALLYGRHAGKVCLIGIFFIYNKSWSIILALTISLLMQAMALGCWAARRMLVERGVSRAIAHENEHLRSELNRLKARLLLGNVESGLATSRGKEVLINLSEDEDADQLDADSPYQKNRWGKLPDSPPSPPPAEPLC